MANDSFQKILVLIVLISISTFSFAQEKKKKITIFSADFSLYIDEISDFMTKTDNQDLKSISNRYKKAVDNLSDNEKELIINISNKMLKKKLRPKQHFSKFLSSIISTINSNKKADLLSWLIIVDKVIDQSSVKTAMLFFDFSIMLVDQNLLRSSKSAIWKISNAQYSFNIENSEPVVVFTTPIDIICSTDYGSYTIFQTTGKYNLNKTSWAGNGGRIYWDTRGLSKDSVYAELKLYKVDLRKTVLTADSCYFYNKYEFKEMIIGNLENRIVKGKRVNSFPKFTSYSKNIEIKNIFSNIDYRGGYILQGKEFVADGGINAEARIVFKRDGEDIFIANATSFNIGDEKIVAKQAGVKIFFENDSIYHGSIQFKYFDDKRQLQLYKNQKSISGAPMLNTYHQITMDFELMEWNVDDDIITFGSLPGTAESTIHFESVDRFLESKFEAMRGIDAVHPLLLINKYIRATGYDNFFVSDFAYFAGYPLLQIKNFLIHLYNDGFIFYDFNSERVQVLPKLYNYVQAASDLGDHDVISFSSTIKTGQYNTGDKNLVNAALNIKSKKIKIIGLQTVNVSNNRGVYLYPNNGIIILQKNRNFIFDGQVLAGRGRLNLYGRNFSFNYNNFKLNFDQIDSIQFSVPTDSKVKDIYGNDILTPIKTLIQAGSGELLIDDPTNKSGIRQDSFPQFPKFRSFDNSYVYYDSYEIYNSVYPRDKFSFHLEPFEIDSLDDYSGAGLSFAGVFRSAGIFPQFNDTLRIQEDYSLGFSRKTPEEGFVIYNGKGRYYNDIFLSNDGLRGNGNFEFLTSKAQANDIIFFPDSMNLHTQLFSIEEVAEGIEFPQVENTETYIHFEPYQERLYVFKKLNNFSLYQSQVELDGDLLMRPTGVTGNGLMTLDNAKINSDLFTYNANWFGSDNASLKLFEESGQHVFIANDLKTDIDLKLREASFYSNGSQSYMELPANQYISYIDQSKWYMDEALLQLGDEIEESKGSEFISVHPDQDSLRFIAQTASYNLEDYIINANGVDYIEVADAFIYPDSGKLSIKKQAKIETLNNAKIIVNPVNKYHSFINAIVDIKSSINYSASAYLEYNDGLNQNQQIFFNTINVNADTNTYGMGNVTDPNILHLGDKFNFKGKVELFGSNKSLQHDGYFQLKHECIGLVKEWVKFKSEINPQDISFILEDNLYNDQNSVLSTSLVMSFDSTDFYSTFLTSKKSVTLDVDILPAYQKLYYDNKLSSYVVSDLDTLSNLYRLNDENCIAKGEGKINLNLNLGQVKINSIGSSSHNLLNKKIIIDNDFLMLDFYFSKEAFDVMYEDLITAPGDELFEYSDEFSKSLARIVGVGKYDDIILDLEMSDEYSKFPDELNHSMIFSNVRFKWDNLNKAYVSKGSVWVHSILDKSIFSILDGYIILEKGMNSDVLTIYLETEFGDIYFFQYKNGRMNVWSTNTDFTEVIQNIPNDRKSLEIGESTSAYIYNLVSEEFVNKVRRQIKKTY
ncbi:MAG: hypothetical protein CMD15_02035 [Flavobacteriales bacterium]|nr:hypothetical protein [Flavobacteriales bacterium]|tara:strand:+ start:66129 stop:70586 length:4458 start_codon:yes stop_codon:yes gene_type:complete